MSIHPGTYHLDCFFGAIDEVVLPDLQRKRETAVEIECLTVIIGLAGGYWLG